MKSYKTLHVWQKSVELVVRVYSETDNFPNEEKFGLISQIRRSAVSIPSNIAEGHGRKSDNELVHYLKISFGSSSELETQIIISNKLGFLTDAATESLISDLTEIRMMLNKFISNLLKAKD